IQGFETTDAVCAISSEGGLFEYGSDQEIIGNLEQLNELTPAGTVVVGSVARESEFSRAQASTRASVRPHTREAFGSLVERGGWKIDESIERPFSDNVRLVKR